MLGLVEAATGSLGAGWTGAGLEKELEFLRIPNMKRVSNSNARCTLEAVNDASGSLGGQ